MDDNILAPGTKVGSYRIEYLLGRGGTGAVYLAFDTTLHRQVALKMITASHESESRRTLLVREARNAAALNHPNICTIYEVGEANGLAFIAMEYVEGCSLRDRIDAGALQLYETVRYGLYAADGLSYAHDHGVVHRDFKAANAIVTNDRRLKIVDFGLARRWDASMADATTMVSLPAGSLMGTPYAMAPEQVRGEPSDARTDIWALGVLLYEMLTGAQPFKAPTTPELFSSILRDPSPLLPRTVPHEVRAVVERCLEKTPERRYQNAKEVGVALEGFQLRAPAGRLSIPYRLAEHRWIVAAASLLAIAVLLLAFNLFGLRDRLVGNAPVVGPVKIAVLPLENLTGDPDQEYLSDGLTDQIITIFSRFRSPRLIVTPRTESALYKHSGKSLDQIGRELTANTILKGSVTRSGDRFRIFAELLQVSDARRLWSETYECTSSDLFAIEHKISQAAASAIGIQMAEPENKRLSEERSLNPEAYDLYLRGLSHAVRQNEQDIDQAIVLLEKSVALDPTFVPAHAYLALTYGNKSSTYRPNESQWEEKGFAAVQKALNLDPDAPEAHYAQAMMLWRPSHRFPSREALQEFRKALSVQPNFDEAWHQHAVVLMHVGHLEAAAHEIQRSLEINPGNTVARFRFGPIFNYQQKFEDAIGALNRVPRETFPAQWTYQRTWALISLGRLDEASRVVESALKDNPADQGGVLHAARSMLRSKRGDRKGAEADIAEAIRVGKNFIHFHHTAYSIGAVYATLGEFDKAQEWIENAANDGFPNYAFFETDVHLASLRATPRFRAFLSKLRAEWEHIPGEPE